MKNDIKSLMLLIIFLLGGSYAAGILYSNGEAIAAYIVWGITLGNYPFVSRYSHIR